MDARLLGWVEGTPRMDAMGCFSHPWRPPTSFLLVRGKGVTVKHCQLLACPLTTFLGITRGFGTDTP